MKVHYNPEQDVLTLLLRDGAVSSRELAEGVAGKYDSQGQLAGFEVRDAVKRFGDLTALRQVVLEGLGPPVSRGKPPSTVVASHIVLDDRGVAWVDDTNVKVIEVVIDRVAWLWSPEAIQRQHPHLSLAQIHAALSYYYDHQAEFDAEMDRQDREYEELLAAQGKDTPIHRKLRALGKIP